MTAPAVSKPPKTTNHPRHPLLALSCCPYVHVQRHKPRTALSEISLFPILLTPAGCVCVSCCFHPTILPCMCAHAAHTPLTRRIVCFSFRLCQFETCSGTIYTLRAPPHCTDRPHPQPAEPPTALQRQSARRGRAGARSGGSHAQPRGQRAQSARLSSTLPPRASLRLSWTASWYWERGNTLPAVGGWVGRVVGLACYRAPPYCVDNRTSKPAAPRVPERARSVLAGWVGWAIAFALESQWRNAQVCRLMTELLSSQKLLYARRDALLPKPAHLSRAP